MIEFNAILHRMTRDREDATKLVLEIDSSEYEKIVNIPAQKLLKVVVEVQE